MSLYGNTIVCDERDYEDYIGREPEGTKCECGQLFMPCALANEKGKIVQSDPFKCLECNELELGICITI